MERQSKGDEMKLLTLVALAAFLAGAAHIASAQTSAATPAPLAPLPDARTAEADLRALITGLQAGQVVAGDRLDEKFAASIQADTQRRLPIWRSFGAPGAMRLESQEGRTYTFVVTHPLSDVKWMVSYKPGGDRVFNIGWELLIPEHLRARMALWHGLTFLPGSIWKKWMLDHPAEHQSIQTCWWVELAVRMECEYVTHQGWRNLVTYTLQGDTVVRTAPNTVPGTYVWHEDGSSTTVHQNLKMPDVRLVERTYYTPQLLTTDWQDDASTPRWVSIREHSPGQADLVFARLSAEHEAAKAARQEAEMARRVEELGTFGPDRSYEQEDAERGTGQGLAILNAFIGGLADGMADNAALANTMYQGMDAYENAASYERGYDDGAGQADNDYNAAAPAAAPAAAAQPLRFVLTIGMRNLPGDTHNSTCYSNVITRSGPPGWGAAGFLPSGSAEQALQRVNSLKSRFIDECRRASGREVTSERNFSHVWNMNETEAGRMEAAGPRHAEDVSVTLP